MSRKKKCKKGVCRIAGGVVKEVRNMAKAERVLWEYRANQRKAEAMRMVAVDLMSVRGQDYGAHTVNGVSDPVMEVVSRKLLLETRIRSIEREIEAVERVKDSLNIEELYDYQARGILRLRYMEHKGVNKVMRELGITKTTYYRRKRELIKRMKEYV